MEVAHCYLDGNADAIEFCSHDSYTNVLAAATYTLQEGDNPRRSGSISLFDVDGDVGRFELFHRVDTAGIFDIKWNPVGGDVDKTMVAQADADGCLRIYELDKVGSDDGKFCCWDLRDNPSNMVFLNSRVHKMGVCCIAKNPSDPNSLITGSYNEHLRVWDVRSTSKPVNETCIHLGEEFGELSTIHMCHVWSWELVCC